MVGGWRKEAGGTEERGGKIVEEGRGREGRREQERREGRGGR